MEARHDPPSQAFLVEYVFTLCLYDFYIVTEILQTTATCFNDVKFGLLWRIQVDWSPRLIKHIGGRRHG